MSKMLDRSDWRGYFGWIGMAFWIIGWIGCSAGTTEPSHESASPNDSGTTVSTEIPENSQQETEDSTAIGMEPFGLEPGNPPDTTPFSERNSSSDGLPESQNNQNIRCGTPTSSFYQPPTPSPVGILPGVAVRCEEIGNLSASGLTADSRFSASGGVATFGYRLFRVMYVTQWPKGTPQWATMLLYLPTTSAGLCQADADIAMVGHGTMGMAPTCGPSMFPNYGLHHLAYPLAGRGVAVVAPDFLGLGVPHSTGHPYLILDPTVQSTLDAVKATHGLSQQGALPGCFGKKVWLLGHSQGGQAALASASRFATTLPEFQLMGTIAWGPAFGDERIWLGPFQPTFQITTATAYFLAYLLAAQRFRQGPALSQWLTPKAASLVPGLLDTLCFSEWDILVRQHFATFADVFSSAFLQASISCQGGQGNCQAFQFWRDSIATSQIPNTPPPAPTLLVQGGLDTVVSPASVGCIAKRWSSSPVFSCVYPQADHLTIIGASWASVVAWIELVRGGKTPMPSACPQQQLPSCP